MLRQSKEDHTKKLLFSANQVRESLTHKICIETTISKNDSHLLAIGELDVIPILTNGNGNLRSLVLLIPVAIILFDFRTS
jgi:hypothetical protein